MSHEDVKTRITSALVTSSEALLAALGVACLVTMVALGFAGG